MYELLGRRRWLCIFYMLCLALICIRYFQGFHNGIISSILPDFKLAQPMFCLFVSFVCIGGHIERQDLQQFIGCSDLRTKQTTNATFLK